jgi:hypothetical protein
LYGFTGNDPINRQDLLGLVLFDQSSSYWMVLLGRTIDPSSLFENFASGDSFAVASGYSYGVLMAPVQLGRALLSPLQTMYALSQIPGMISSGQLKCLLGDQWTQFEYASPDEQLNILGGIIGSGVGTWATGGATSLLAGQLLDLAQSVSVGLNLAVTPAATTTPLAVAAADTAASITTPLAVAAAEGGTAALTTPGNVPLGFNPVSLEEGSFVNRVYDSSGAPGTSQLFGQSFSPGSGLPTDAATAIAERGLNPGINNAQLGGVFQVNQSITVYQGTSLGGTAPELFIPSGLHQYLTPVLQGVPIVP